MALVRAFVATAEELHFGRAADRLLISQQALSKRIGRLEAILGVALFDRSTRTVNLTETGRLLVQPAREALTAADALVLAVRDEAQILRVDVLHERLSPGLMMRRLVEDKPDVTLELSSRRSLAIAVSALLRGEVDLTFGRVQDKLNAALDSRIVRLEPLVVVVAADHELTRLSAVTPHHLSRYGLWTPTPGSASEWSGFVSSFAEAFDCLLEFPNVDNVTAKDVRERSHGDGPAFLSATDVQNPIDPMLTVLDLVDPVPVFPWSLVWVGTDRRPPVRGAIDALLEISHRSGWCSALTQPHWPPQLLET